MWKEIKGTHGQYFVSDQGEIKNNRGRILKQFKTPSGVRIVTLYGYVGLTTNSIRKRKSIEVHRIVYETFADTKLPPWAHIRHRNGDYSDNSFDNLYVV